MGEGLGMSFDAKTREDGARKLREFGIREICYAFCLVTLVGEIAISLPLQSYSEGMVSYSRTCQLTILPFAFSSF
ncbi:hypothetical protein HMPREF1991_02698 [Hoylesella loescheii DSM 19665 = JCM 12249 = ATCC 15930]|uniref:Uncharacterized protein n=1 Tax=Hoylesella loescheii DSM 19665 = JCM 12249 = ATCC 15930 TaxID=1122985 RepID=A0A069QEN6_HOYLO|nr:hypothetical protein HMPREF1991_02698 [Hoylesella loescheii DSM 19665 = JCM 12249 = ATCC 15930]